MREAGHSHEAYASKFELVVVMVASMLGVLMLTLDMTIANVALPYMQGSLSASRDQITWVLTSYIIVSAIMTGPVGWLAARFGRKNFLLFSMIGFTAASMACGAAQSLEQMILFRIIQGATGAALAPLSQSIMLDMYPPEKRGPVMALWGMGIMLGPVLGPTLGGYLTSALDWRWIFFVNIIFGIPAVAGIWLFYKDTARNADMRFDWFGFIALAVGLGALQLMLDRGTGEGWFDSSEIVIEALVAAVGLYLFVVHMVLGKSPFMPPQIFTNRNFLFSLLLMFSVGAVLLASSALLPPYLQNLAGKPIEHVGLLMAPRGLGTMFAMMIAGRFATRWDPRIMMSAGAALMVWSLWQMSGWTPQVGDMTIVSISFLQGVGMGLVFVPMNLVAFATLPAQFRTDGAALTNLFRNIGSAIGVSVVTTLMTNGAQVVHSEMAGHASALNPALKTGIGGIMMNPNLPMGLARLEGMIAYRAQEIVFSNAFLLMVYVSLPVFLCIWIMKRPQFSRATAPKMEVVE